MSALISASTFRLDGRVALVTGSSTGIGFALAQALGEAGATVVLNGRDAARLASAQDSLKALGLTVHARAFDVCDAVAAEAAVASIEAEVGPIAILINNAGLTRRGAFHELSAADWQTVMRTNVDSVFVVGQAVARRMVPRGRGRIINTCSVMSELGRPGTVAYTASKGALKMLTKGMAIDLGPHGINVNGLGPGSLNLGDCVKVTDEGLKYLGNCHTLILGNCSITDEGLKYLTNCKILDLFDCFDITKEGKKCLTKCRVLG